jgi:hypothetical protein
MARDRTIRSAEHIMVFLRFFMRMFKIGYFRFLLSFVESVHLFDILSEVRGDFPQPFHTNYLRAVITVFIQILTFSLFMIIYVPAVIETASSNNIRKQSPDYESKAIPLC